MVGLVWEDEIRRKIEEKKELNEIPLILVRHPPAHAGACLIRRRDRDRYFSSQQEVMNDVQGPPRVFRGQFRCAESSEGAHGPTMVRRSQGEPRATTAGVEIWGETGCLVWPSNLLTVPIYRLIKENKKTKKQKTKNKNQQTNNKQKQQNQNM